MKYLRLLLFILIPLSAGAIGALAPSRVGYGNLIQPFFAPPSWVFGPVWTFLYITIGVAGFLAWEHGSSNIRKKAFTVYIIQLVLNAIWTPLFFGLELRLVAFFEMILLWFFIVINIIYFYKLDKLSGLILIPYLLWVSFASVLAFFVWNLNV